MHHPKELKTLFLDMNSYFASVEQQLTPELRGKPVIVIPTETRATCAIAASYEAKALGIKTNTPVWEAEKICPDIKIVNARHDVYVDFHHKIMDEVNKHIPIEKICSIDEVSCTLPRRFRDKAKARDLAKHIKQKIRENVGEYIQCSIGIASNRLLAKMASDMNKPNGLTILDPKDIPDALYKLKLEDIPGIGRNMKKRLNDSGVWSIYDFCELQPKQARKIWGSIEGERFWYRLRGYEVPSTPTKKTMIGHSHMLAPQLRSEETSRLVARRLCSKAAARLRRTKFKTSRISLSVRLQNGEKWKRELNISPTDNSFCLLSSLDALWGLMTRHFGRTVTVKKIAVAFTGLRATDNIINDLFNDHAANSNQEQTANLQKLCGTMDTVNQRFGRDSVFIGALPHVSSQNGRHIHKQSEGVKKSMGLYSGAKIAFNRIPDREEFCE